MCKAEYNPGNTSEASKPGVQRGGPAADCTKKSADVAQGVSQRSSKPAEVRTSKPRKVNPHAAVRKARRERYSRYIAAQEAIRESLFEAEVLHLPSELSDCVSPSVTREDRFFISRECGVATVEDGEGWFAYQQRTPVPRVLSHEGEAAVLFARVAAEEKRRAQERDRERGFGKAQARSTKGGR